MVSLMIDRRLAGLNEKKAKAILDWRKRNQRFTTREEVLQCKGIGKKTYEQCVGFLRVLPTADQDDRSTTSTDLDRRGSNGKDVILVNTDSDNEAVVEIGNKRKHRGKESSVTSRKKAKRSKTVNGPHNPLDMTFIHPESYGVAER
jgi:competence ComEA-like helix-hairpin-helix protein